MRVFVSLISVGSVLALTACTPAVPDSGAEAGFDTSPFDAPPPAGTTIFGEPLVPPIRVESTSLDAPTAAPRSPGSSTSAGTFRASSGNSDIASETAAALSASQSNTGQAPLQASPSNPAPLIVGNAGISDENDFGAVSSRQSIESDADRLAENRSQYQVIEPTAVPVRQGDAGPNVVSYALSATNPLGTRIYSRTGINLRAKSERNCAGYRSSDLAQQAFLEAGGPKRDRLALDVDGDGYACDWDPLVYQHAVQN
ncbi:hypothetical protein EBB79_14075 [Parasedimentitalea marina]|uniref:Excalibur calcium-binding domain-containing protein n=1 Tax=Parasedimentitalea marina TaxID=2483033 RepID=A0A3T0N4F3_9RHOB|nr:hypothetical protein [Parasedimentitalea marina]AZV78884.1 hypothetical protein EBB79_14075 [Parasedimentitalea marina]